MAIQHSTIAPNDVHVPYSFTVGNTAALTTLLSQVTADHVGKLCRQTDTEKLFLLTMPDGVLTWKEIGSGGSGNIVASDVGCTVLGISPDTFDLGSGGSAQTALNYLYTNKAPAVHTHGIGAIVSLQTSLDAKVPLSAKNVANGYAGLDSSGKLSTSVLPITGSGAVATLDQSGRISSSALPTDVPLLTNGKLSDSVIPSLALTDVYVVADNTARDALLSNNTPEIQQGDVVTVTSTASTYIYDGSAWVLLRTPAGGITSFNERTGPAISPTLGDYAANQIMCTAIGVDPDLYDLGTNGTVKLALDYLYLNKAAAIHTHGMGAISGLTEALAAKVNITSKDQANGYAGLDANGKISASVLPSSGTQGSVVILDSNDTIPLTQIPAIPLTKLDSALQTVISTLQADVATKAPISHNQLWTTIQVAGADESVWGTGTNPANIAEAINRLASLLKTHLGITIPTLV